MDERNSRASLGRIRMRLAKALEILQVQITEIDQELSGSPNKAVELNDAFFWEQVFPRLLANREMTSAKLREALISGGNEVDESRFRTFLSRARKRGLVEKRDRFQGEWPVWSLTDDAMSLLKQRVDRKK